MGSALPAAFSYSIMAMPSYSPGSAAENLNVTLAVSWPPTEPMPSADVNDSPSDYTVVTKSAASAPMFISVTVRSIGVLGNVVPKSKLLLKATSCEPALGSTALKLR